MTVLLFKKARVLLGMVSIVSLISCPFVAADTQGQTERQLQPSAAGLDGISKAISDIELSFVQPGKIREIMVKEGDLVHAGAILMQQADEIELVQLKILQARSLNRLPIHLAEVDLKQKQKDLADMKDVQKKGAITQWEVDHASLAVDTALLTLKIREFEHNQDVLQLESIVETINRLTLRSPLEGIVEEISIQPGETVQALMPVIRLVRIDFLLIDLPVPIDQAKDLRKGQKAIITFSDQTELPGEIIKISSIADAAATTLEVRLQVPNPEERPAGERVRVVFSDASQEKPQRIEPVSRQ